MRTKRVVELVGDAIIRLRPEMEEAAAQSKAASVLKLAGLDIKPPRKKDVPEESTYLLFLSAQQIEALADLATQDGDIDKKLAQAVIKDKNSIDLALFGRMVANVTDLNVEASCQVAHALSTHAVENEYDYFTAVDDHKVADAEEDAGAGMIGTIEFNSATLYRYATVDVSQLAENLGDVEATTLALGAFLQAFVKSMPTGKQNTFANRTLPEAVVIAVRSDQPVSFVGAFEEPVSAVGGRASASVAKLVEYAQDVASAYGDRDTVAWAVGVGPVKEKLGEIGQVTTLDAVIKSVVDTVSEYLASPTP
jgi:CRISPR system Cascade subunit CasC